MQYVVYTVYYILSMYICFCVCVSALAIRQVWGRLHSVPCRAQGLDLGVSSEYPEPETLKVAVKTTPS